MHENKDLRRSLESLVALGRTPEVDIRPVLLRVLVDLFIRKQHHSASELAQFEEIALRLFDGADEETRLVVAEKLSRCEKTPASFLDRLLQEGGRLAECALAHARLQTEVLLAAATWGSADQATAVARRPDLDLAVSKSLAERPEREIVMTLVQNPLAPLDRSLFQSLVRRARGDDEFSRVLLNRDCEPVDLAPLFMLASSERRAAIILSACRDDLGPETRRPRLGLQAAAALARIERSLVSDQDSFDVAFAAALNIPLDEVWGIIDDPRGEPLAIALAAVGASPDFAARVFILSGPAIGHSVMAVRSLIAIVDNMSMRTANRLLAAMVGISERSAPKKRAAYEPESSPARRRSASDGKAIRAPAAPGQDRVFRERTLR